jgi:hypothetical protein
MKMLVTAMAIAASVVLATPMSGDAASAQEYLSQEAAYVQRHHPSAEAHDAQANPRGGTGQRATGPDDVITGNRVIGRDPDPFIRGEILRHNDSGWPD